MCNSCTCIIHQFFLFRVQKVAAESEEIERISLACIRKTSTAHAQSSWGSETGTIFVCSKTSSIKIDRNNFLLRNNGYTNIRLL